MCYVIKNFVEMASSKKEKVRGNRIAYFKRRGEIFSENQEMLGHLTESVYISQNVWVPLRVDVYTHTHKFKMLCSNDNG